ncbi:uncharacterized protein BCR38DRAFT_347157 [Pseudomassariella vexata]|uniref:Uncharacterized protein n=1 Tax=Pseudomassariella vexata TaxID=1141098 RepID=A0A1Y2DSD4_9PEZI|nr:uncharacterized protein BCR38DRAFT_347157 [Pseudomassariella vexata]ORY62172.1 hypothetical protein BCR38DRAFT_347157 [Pseudomassariella vexata]
MADSYKEETITTRFDASPETNSKASKGHCKRFWWVYILVLVVIVVIVVPVVLLVAVPKIAQQKINEAKLHVDSIVVTNTRPNVLNMAINSTITTDGKVHATIAGFQSTMYLMDVDPPLAFATLDFPQTKSDALMVVNISQELTFDNLDAVKTFNAHLLSKEKINVKIEGDTNVRVSGIARNYPVSFSKNIEMVGFNNFAGVVVTNPHVNLNPVNNFNATANLPNPTIWTVEIGNATFHNYLNGSDIGTAYILDVVLRPGDNEFFIWADVNQAPILNALTLPPACETGNLTIDLGGKTVMNNGQTISYFQDAFASSNVSAIIDIGAAVKNDIGLSIPCKGSS